jgi:hypothetical protein
MTYYPPLYSHVETLPVNQYDLLEYLNKDDFNNEEDSDDDIIQLLYQVCRESQVNLKEEYLKDSPPYKYSDKPTKYHYHKFLKDIDLIHTANTVPSSLKEIFNFLDIQGNPWDNSRWLNIIEEYIVIGYDPEEDPDAQVGPVITQADSTRSKEIPIRTKQLLLAIEEAKTRELGHLTVGLDKLNTGDHQLATFTSELVMPHTSNQLYQSSYSHEPGIGNEPFEAQDPQQSLASRRIEENHGTHPYLTSQVANKGVLPLATVTNNINNTSGFSNATHYFEPDDNPFSMGWYTQEFNELEEFNRLEQSLSKETPNKLQNRPEEVPVHEETSTDSEPDDSSLSSSQDSSINSDIAETPISSQDTSSTKFEEDPPSIIEALYWKCMIYEIDILNPASDYDQPNTYPYVLYPTPEELERFRKDVCDTFADHTTPLDLKTECESIGISGHPMRNVDWLEDMLVKAQKRLQIQTEMLHPQQSNNKYIDQPSQDPFQQDLFWMSLQSLYHRI